MRCLRYSIPARNAAPIPVAKMTARANKFIAPACSKNTAKEISTQNNTKPANAIINHRDGRMITETAIDRAESGSKRNATCPLHCAVCVRSDLAKNQRTVGAAKTKRVFDCDLDIHVARRVGTIVKIASGIRVVEIDRRRRFLMMYC